MFSMADLSNIPDDKTILATIEKMCGVVNEHYRTSLKCNEIIFCDFSLDPHHFIAAWGESGIAVIMHKGNKQTVKESPLFSQCTLKSGNKAARAALKNHLFASL